jgi:hypothetical protein
MIVDIEGLKKKAPGSDSVRPRIQEQGRVRH